MQNEFLAAITTAIEVACSNFDCNKVVAVWLIAAGTSCAGAVAAGLQAASASVIPVVIAASLAIMRTIQGGGAFSHSGFSGGREKPLAWFSE